MTGSTRLVVTLAFVGSLLLQLSWVVAVPPYRGMDEFDHVYRAESVAAGHWLPVAQDPAHQARGDLVRVSAATVRAAYPICHSYSYIQEIDCLPSRTFADGTVLVASGAARYNPAYYGVIGTPTRWFGPVTALYLMRGLDALVCSLLVALAAWCLTRWSRTAWPLLGLALTCTPMAMYSGSTPAPNGPEMFAGVALWAALLGLARVDAGTPAARSLLLATLPAALVLVTVRTLGPLWLALIVLSVVAVLGLARTAAVVRAQTRLVLAVSALVTLATLAAVWWTSLAGANSLAHEPDRHLPNPVAGTLHLLPFWVLQTVGTFPDKGQPAPDLVYAAALPLMGGLLLWGFRHGTTRLRWSMVAVALAWIGVALVVTLRTYAQLGPVWQGRYAWPYAAGLLLVAAFALDRARAWLSPRAIGGVVLLGLLLVHLPGPLSVLLDESRTSPLAGSAAWLLPYPGLVAGLGMAGLGAWLAALLNAGMTPAGSPVDVSGTETATGSVRADATAAV